MIQISSMIVIFMTYSNTFKNELHFQNQKWGYQIYSVSIHYIANSI